LRLKGCVLKVSRRVLALTSVQEVPGVVVGWVVFSPQAAAELVALMGRPAACKTVADSTIAPATPLYAFDWFRCGRIAAGLSARLKTPLWKGAWVFPVSWCQFLVLQCGKLTWKECSWRKRIAPCFKCETTFDDLQTAP
jgi:hypothetical protein